MVLDTRRNPLANPNQVATLAGHTSISVVLDRYGHLYPQQYLELRSAMENQNKRLLPEVAAESSDVNDSSGDVEHGEQPADVVAIRSDDRDIVMASDPGCSDRDWGIDGVGATGPRITSDPLITTTRRQWQRPL